MGACLVIEQRTQTLRQDEKKENIFLFHIFYFTFNYNYLYSKKDEKKKDNTFLVVVYSRLNL